MSYICVDDIEETVEKAVQPGESVLIPVKTAGEMGRLAIIQDPTGAQIAFW